MSVSGRKDGTGSEGALGGKGKAGEARARGGEGRKGAGGPGGVSGAWRTPAKCSGLIGYVKELKQGANAGDSALLSGGCGPRLRGEGGVRASDGAGALIQV